MTNGRDHVLLSAAISLDGYLDDASDTRLILSCDEDMAEVRRLRSRYDAIIVGGRTVQRDNPSLLADGDAQPRKIVITENADLDPNLRFFVTGDVEKRIWCGRDAYARTARRFCNVATTQPFDGFDELGSKLAELQRGGAGRIMVEGGSHILTQFLTRGLADELRLAIAPFFVGDSKAPRFVNPGGFGHDTAHRAQLVDTTQVGDMAVLRYRLTR